MADIGAFVASLSEEALEKLTKEQLLKLAEYYEVTVGDKLLKEGVKGTVKAKLVEIWVITSDVQVPPLVSMSPTV